MSNTETLTDALFLAKTIKRLSYDDTMIFAQWFEEVIENWREQEPNGKIPAAEFALTIHDFADDQILHQATTQTEEQTNEPS